MWFDATAGIDPHARMTAAPALIVKGIALGLGAAAPIGPVNVQIARRTLRAGFAGGFFLGCGAVTADVIYAVLSSIGLQRVADLGVVQWPLRVAGIGLLTYLGVVCLRGERDAWRHDPVSANAEAMGGSMRSAYVTGLAMTLFNPMTLAFWFVAVPAMAGSQPIYLAGHRARDPAQDLPLLCVGVFIGTLAWVTTFCALLAFAGRYRRNGWLALADGVGGVTLLVFAAAALLSSLGPFL